jgi:hypothetical protein
MFPTARGIKTGSSATFRTSREMSASPILSKRVPVGSLEDRLVKLLC